MNSNAETSPPSTNKTPSSTSSSEVDSLYQKTFLEAPLRALCQKPMDEMTEDELRAEVARIRQMRDNHQRFKSVVEEEAGQRQNEPKKDLLEGWE